MRRFVEGVDRGQTTLFPGDSIVRHIFGDWRKTAPSEAILPKHSRSCAFTKLVCDSDAGEKWTVSGCEMRVAGLRA
jgi:hypothetical protein